MRQRLGLFVLLFGLLCISLAMPISALAQATCPQLVSAAISSIGTLCGELGRNNACYGNTEVSATFSQPVAADYFSTPGSRADVSSIQTLRTAPLDLARQVWGISVMNLIANLPNSLPGQGVILMLFGGVEIENAVPEDSAYTPVDGVSVQLASEARLIALPVRGLPELTRIPANASVSADAVSTDGEFVRVTFSNRVGWVERSAVSSAANLSGLPALSPDAQTPMQSFFLRTGIGGLECQQAPSIVNVQGPRGTQVDLRVQNVDVRIGSDMILRTTGSDPNNPQVLELITVSGLIVVFPNSPNPVYVPPGYIIKFDVSQIVPPSRGGGANQLTPPIIEGPRPLTQDELNLYSYINNVGTNLLYYPIVLPTIFPPGTSGTIPQIIVSPGDLGALQSACATGLISRSICAQYGL